MVTVVVSHLSQRMRKELALSVVEGMGQPHLGSFGMIRTGAVPAFSPNSSEQAGPAFTIGVVGSNFIPTSMSCLYFLRTGFVSGHVFRRAAFIRWTRTRASAKPVCLTPQGLKPKAPAVMTGTSKDVP